MQPVVFVPVTVYVMDVVGLADTELPVVEFKAVAGDQVYVSPPEAISVIELPSHSDALVGETVTTGILRATKTVAVSVQPLASVPVTV